MNTNKCETCEHFDAVIRGTKTTTWGWCAKRSEYPATEGPGQIFPIGVKRVDAGQPAKPFIVRQEQVVGNCTDFIAKKPRATKQELVNQLLTKKGKVVLR